MSPLRRRMIEDMTVRDLSPATQPSYLHAVTKFSRYFGRSPERLGLEDVRAFQVHLVSTGISWPALNQTVCAPRFFYGITLGHGEIPERISYAREPRKPPVVLNADEVVRFLEAVPSLRTRAAPTTAHAAGLRASEAVGPEVADIDSVRMVIRVEHGKGGKDRFVMLSSSSAVACFTPRRTASTASVITASSPMAIAKRSWRFAASCWPLHRQPNPRRSSRPNRSKPPSPCGAAPAAAA